MPDSATVLCLHGMEVVLVFSKSQVSSEEKLCQRKKEPVFLLWGNQQCKHHIQIYGCAPIIPPVKMHLMFLAEILQVT